MSTINQQGSNVGDKMSSRMDQSFQSSNSQIVWSTRLKSYISVEVTASHADILLLICCIISGLVDSTIYNAYGTFVSMQTVITLLFFYFNPLLSPCVFVSTTVPHGDHKGNTIFLGLGGSTPHDTSKPYGWVKSFASIVCFCLGCFVFSFTSRLLTPLRRSTLTASFLIQSLFILVTAAIIQGGVVNGSLDTITDDITWRQLLPIALLSFQSAGQIVGSRVLGLAEVPTVVLTSMLHDISTDPALLGPLRKNIKRNRRVLAFVAILVGAVAGGFISEKSRRMQIPLWIAGGTKLCVASAWMLWPEKRVTAV